MLKAMLSALLVVAIGISAAPNLDGAVALGIAGLISIIAAGVTAIQVYIPQLDFRSYMGEFAGNLMNAFVRAGLGAFLTAIAGWLAMPNFETWKSVLIGAIVGGINAGLRAIQGALTKTERPFIGRGTPPPKPEPA